MNEPLTPVAPDIHLLIHSIRGHRVILDSDLAHLYDVPTKSFNQAVKRNIARFPGDFLFQLTAEEHENLKSQFVTSSSSHGGRRTLPYAFTEHGALQAANILNSPKAQAMGIYVIRAFIRMREELSANQSIAKRLAEIEKSLLSHNSALRDIYQKIRPLLLPPPLPNKPPIGFQH